MRLPYSEQSKQAVFGGETLRCARLLIHFFIQEIIQLSNRFEDDTALALLLLCRARGKRCPNPAHEAVPRREDQRIGAIGQLMDFCPQDPRTFDSCSTLIDQLPSAEFRPLVALWLTANHGRAGNGSMPAMVHGRALEHRAGRDAGRVVNLMEGGVKSHLLCLHGSVSYEPELHITIDTPRQGRLEIAMHPHKQAPARRNSKTPRFCRIDLE